MAGGKLISTGVEFPDATTQTTSGLPLTGGTMTGALTTTGFTSTGIDDNATSTAITIDASENVGINNTNPAHALDVTGDIEVSGRIALGTGASQVATVNAYSRDVASNVYSAIRIIDSTTASTHFDVGLTGTDLKFYHNSVYPPKMTLSSAGQLTIKDNLVIGTSGKGIDFSADGNAGGMTSEVLDDYEEGTWTIAVTLSTSGTATLNTTYQTGGYTKVGNLVTVTGFLIISSVSSPTGDIRVSLPFTCGTGVQQSTISCGGIQLSNMNILATTQVNPYVSPGKAYFILAGTNDNAAATFEKDGAIESNSRMNFSLSYMTDS